MEVKIAEVLGINDLQESYLFSFKQLQSSK